MASSQPLRVALVGVGKIARDQHLPALAASGDVELVATIDLRGGNHVEGVPAFNNLADAFATHPDIEAAILCTPPQGRYQLASEALTAGRHVFLEKPPGACLSEVQSLERLAREQGVALFASWHSRFAAGVDPARQWLADKTIQGVKITWKEDVRRWHPGQDWIFEAGGMGVFDPAINALSIATYILPTPFALVGGTLDIPANRQAPIAATLLCADEDQIPIDVELDFLQQGDEVWNIDVATGQGSLRLSCGGANLAIDGKVISLTFAGEYTRLYQRFVALVRAGELEVDLQPLVHVADAFLLAERRRVEAFDW